MVVPQSLLDALDESITSGTFIDTKFYVFSRRGASGRVDSPRSLYCNSHVLNTVPYFSALFSDFSEGQIKDINEGFPSDSLAHADSYDYFSDSDLEDESPCPGEGEECTGSGEPGMAPSARDPGSQVPPPAVSAGPPQQPQGSREAENDQRRDKSSVRMGKVAIVPDMAAVTFMAMIYFLYTGEVTFAPFTSNACHKQSPVKERSGGWNAAGPLPPSAKSVYRLADKYDIPTLKERAKAHIYENMEQCNIVDEVFSSFSLSFPEILSAQVSRLVNKMKHESMWGFGSVTKRQLEEKITGLTQSGLTRATDALVMIWNGVIGPLDLPSQAPTPPFSQAPTPPLSPPKFIALPNWHRIKLALLKSILTGTFIDVQFYAYNAIHDNLPVDLKPLFTSSVMIEEWAPAIATQTVGIESKAAYIMDELTDDYECWGGERTETQRKDKTVVKHRTEAITVTESREVVVLTSGAWKTWLSLLSHSYTSKTTFSPLQSSVPCSEPPADAKIHWRRTCSPRSMYSLAVSLGIEDIKDEALKDIQSKLTTSNITQELFTTFTANHKAVMDIEIEFLHKNFTEKNPTLLIEHIKRMAYGEAQFFSKTLGLVYGRLVEKVFAPPLPHVPLPVTAAPPEKEKAESDRSILWGEKGPISSVTQTPSVLETPTPVENEDEEFDWLNSWKKKKKGPAGSGVQASVQNTPDPDNADDGAVGGGSSGKKKKKKGGKPFSTQLPSTQQMRSNAGQSWFFSEKSSEKCDQL